MKPTVEDLRNEIIGVMSSEKSSNEKFDRIVFLFNKSGLIEQKLLTSPSAKEPSKSAEDFLKEKGIWIGMDIQPEDPSKKPIYLENLLEEYAQQFTSNKPEVTEEEINKMAIDYIGGAKGMNKTFVPIFKRIFRDGIKKGLSLFPDSAQKESDAVEFARYLCVNGWESCNGAFYKNAKGDICRSKELYDLFTKTKGKV